MGTLINTFMERISIPNLHSNEIGFETGNETYPLARVRVVPVDLVDERQGELTGIAAPSVVAVRLSASLVDDDGAVEMISGRLLVGPEAVHSWQFDNQTAAFDPQAWIDSCAEPMIESLLHKASVLSLAANAGLITQV